MAKVIVEENNLSFQRISEKCIACGRCLETCKTLHNLSFPDCISCGQCIHTCPMGALQPRYHYKEVLANLHDEEKIVVVSIAPATRVAIGDAFSFAPGEFLEKKLVGALKKLGFSYVFDITFGADLTIMEEASELVERLKTNTSLPLFTSCCPSWVSFMEKYHEKDLEHLSTCKSPIGMQGAIIKNYFSKVKHLRKEDIVTVTIAPCISKKKEIKREILQENDYILTTSELCLLLREQHIDLKEVEEASFDSLLGKGSGAGLIFGTSGGVMEAALRTAYFLLKKKEAPASFFALESVRGKENFKEAEIDFGDIKIKVAVLYGMRTVKQVYESLKEYHFVEVMACPNGCIGGGGQPVLPMQKQTLYIEERKKSLYKEDSRLKKRSSYENEEVKTIYEEFLGCPLSEVSKRFLHTSYGVSSKNDKVMEET